jgi:hypothetical protein
VNFIDELAEKASKAVGQAQEDTLDNWDFDNPPNIWAILARAAIEDSLPALFERIEQSFDQTYGEWRDDGYMDEREIAYRDGYRHREKQLQTLFELLKEQL